MNAFPYSQTETHPLAIRIPTCPTPLLGDIVIPLKAHALVIFAHGSGSSRHSPRNQFVAQILQKSGLGTLLFDLLTEEEERLDNLTGEFRFDIALLTTRLIAVTQWILAQPEMPGLRLGYFGASTGAAAALAAAAELPDHVGAVVSRGGRPDLAEPLLPIVKAPTLLIVGGRDDRVIQLNKEACSRMRCEKKLSIIAGATHLFEEPHTLQEVAKLSADWFCRHLDPAGAGGSAP